ncbi:MAG: DUF4240 domain-containing protein [Planctomycetota bacterium]
MSAPTDDDALWSLLDATRPDLAKLAAHLEAMSQGELEAYQLAFVRSMEDVASDWSDGIRVGDRVLSEDDMEDFCAWVVGEGRAIFERATAPGADLAALVTLRDSAERGGVEAHPRWAPTRPLASDLRGYLSPYYLAIPIYERRFEGDLRARVEELLDAEDA